MPRDGSGNYSLPSGNPVVTNTVISSSGWANPTLSDIAAAITQSLSRDGQTTPTANLTMGNFRLLNLGNASARSDAINAGQVQDSSMLQLSSISGTDTITASSAPAITAYTAGQNFYFPSSGTNTTEAVTLNINGLGAKAVMKMGPLGLVQLGPGDIQSGQFVHVIYDGTEFQMISPLPPTSGYTLRNKFINGDFSIWQNNTSYSAVAATGSYTADQWIAASGTSGTMNVARQNTTVGDTLAQSKYFIQLVQTVAAVGQPGFFQRLEGVSTFSGRFVTLTIAGYVASGTLALTPQVAQAFGTGGSPSSTVVTNYPAITLTTSEQVISTTFQIPSISGKTLGTSGTDSVQVGFTFPASSTFTVNILSMQVEDGTVPTPFEKRHPQFELAMAQRYFWQGQPFLSLDFPSYVSGSIFGVTVSFPVPMLFTPTVNNSLTTATLSNCTFTGFNAATQMGARFLLTSTAVNQNCFITLGASDALNAVARL